MNKKYSITIQELLERPIIRNDFTDEWMNKMTDEEILQYDKETKQICIENGTPEKFPDINAAFLGKSIDRSIMYNMFKSGSMNLSKFKK